MSLLTLIIVIVLAGVVLWAVNTFIPMDANVKRLLSVVVVVVLVCWVLQAFGLFGELGRVRIH